jgi:hypothetical protein
MRRKHHVQHGSDDFSVNVIGTGPIVFAQAGVHAAATDAGAEVTT